MERKQVRQRALGRGESARAHQSSPRVYEQIFGWGVELLSARSGAWRSPRLAGHKDLFTGEIVGYAMGERMTKNLVSQSLFRALRAKRPARCLTHHSDRGSQYCSQEYRGFLERSGLRSSMSGKGNCFGNAPMESFWATLKQELVHHRHYRSRQEAAREITEYIELFYNHQRRQARLGFLSPAAYEQRFYAGLPAA